MLLFLYLLHVVCTRQYQWAFKITQYFHTCAHTACSPAGNSATGCLLCTPHVRSPVQPGQTAAARQSCRHPATWTGTPGSVLQSQENHPWVWFHCSSPPPWSAATLYATDWEDESSPLKIKLYEILKCVKLNLQVHGSPWEKNILFQSPPPKSRYFNVSSNYPQIPSENTDTHTLIHTSDFYTGTNTASYSHLLMQIGWGILKFWIPLSKETKSSGKNKYQWKPQLYFGWPSGQVCRLWKQTA